MAVKSVFLGAYNEGLLQQDALYAVGSDGDITKIFDPRLNLPEGAYGGSIGQSSFAQSADGLYFTVTYFTLVAQPNVISTDVHVMRIDERGVVETIAVLPDAGTANVDYGGADALDTALGGDSAVFVNLAPDREPGDPRFPADVIEISPDGEITTRLDFTRTGYPGATWGLAEVGDTVFAIANQQTGPDNTELWRTTAGGAPEVVFHNTDLSVLDLESFDDKAWFITGRTENGLTSNVLRTAGETGGTSRVSVGTGEIPVFLDTDAGGLHVVTRNDTDFAADRIIRMETDGSFTELLNGTALSEIIDLVSFAGSLYALGFGTTTFGVALWRVDPDGSATEVDVFLGSTTAANANLRNLVVTGDKLWFQANLVTPDGSGGFGNQPGYFSMDATGTVTRVASLPGHYDGIQVFTGIPFSFDSLPEIRGTQTRDRIEGTDSADEILGRGGKDNISGGRGNDILRGENGHDVLRGGRGADTLVGGEGADTFVFAPRGGRDVIVDFEDDIDTLSLAQSLSGGGLTAQQVVDTYGSVSGRFLVLDFGTEEIRISGLSSMSDLVDDLRLI